MYDEENIILMSKLAAYEAGTGASDLSKSQYFRKDYVYKQNMWTRFLTLLGSLIICLLRVLHITTIDGKDLFAVFKSGESIKMLIFIVIVQVFYTAVGMRINRNEYEKSRKRLERYYSFINELDRRRKDL